MSYTMSKLVPRGFTPLMTPDLVRESVFEKCGFQPRGDNTQVYSVRGAVPAEGSHHSAGSGLCLTGTAEIPLGGVYMDATLAEADLPLKMAAFGHCFRTEAGAAGSGESCAAAVWAAGATGCGSTCQNSDDISLL